MINVGTRPGVITPEEILTEASFIETIYRATPGFEAPPIEGDQYSFVVDLHDGETGDVVGSIDVPDVTIDAEGGFAPIEFEVPTEDGDVVQGTIQGRRRLADNAPDVLVNIISNQLVVGLVIQTNSGPPPIDDAIICEPVWVWAKWVVTGPDASGAIGPDGETITFELIDEAGNVLDLESGNVEELPAVMFSFGKGTSQATTTTSARPELL